MSVDHSISDPDFHLKELLNALEPTTLFSRDGERTLLHNNTSSIKLPRPSDQTNGKTMLWKSKVMVDQLT